MEQYSRIGLTMDESGVYLVPSLLTRMLRRKNPRELFAVFIAWSM